MILLGAASLYFVSIIVGGLGLLPKDWTRPQGHGRSSRSTTELVSSVLCCSNLSRSLSDNLSLPFSPYFPCADGPTHTVDKSARIHLIQKPLGCSAPAEKIQRTWRKPRRFWSPLRWILRNDDCECLTRNISEKAGLYEDQMGVHKHSVLNLFHKAAHQICDQIQSGLPKGCLHSVVLVSRHNHSHILLCFRKREEAAQWFSSSAACITCQLPASSSNHAAHVFVRKRDLRSLTSCDISTSVVW